MLLSKSVRMKQGQKPSANRSIIISVEGNMDRISSPNLQENMKSNT